MISAESQLVKTHRHTLFCMWCVCGWSRHSPIWDCATIVDFRSQRGENGRPSSASLSPWKYESFLSQSHSQSLVSSKIHSSLQPHTHTHTHIHTHTPPPPPHAHTLLSTGFRVCLAPAPWASGPQMCFIFSFDLSQTDEMWSREAMFFGVAIYRQFISRETTALWKQPQ